MGTLSYGRAPLKKKGCKIMLRDDAHCSKCHKAIEVSEAPYCTGCGDKILEELGIVIERITINEKGETVFIDAVDDEFGRYLQHTILVMYKQQKDRRLSQLN